MAIWQYDLLGSVFEAVAVALEDEHLGVMDEPVDHGTHGDGVAEDLGPGGKVLLLETMRLARS